MKISISATNPCHLFPFARELAKVDALDCYYSGYPAWKLRAPAGVRVRTHSLRTNVVYGLMKFAPESLRPSSRSLFLWQDHGFDRWVGRHLKHCDFIHGMPGQCLETFRAAKRQGIQTVLNHATGPVREWVRIMAPEYERVALRLSDVCPYDSAYFAREDEEYALADWHCVASTVVREQLVQLGIPRERIWLVPYGADAPPFSPDSSSPPPEFRIIFAGQAGLRKGIRTLLQALELAGAGGWTAHFYGAVLKEAERDFAEYNGATPLHFYGAVSQHELADAFRSCSLLVLPSLEEGFGLVVPQALACGVPVVVSDRVGAKDLVRHRENGSVVPVQDPAALAAELRWWASHPQRVQEDLTWKKPVELLLSHSWSAMTIART